MSLRRSAPLIAVAVGLAANPACAASDGEGQGPSRTTLKTLTYISLSALNDFAYGVVASGNLAIGGTFALVSLATEPFLYYAHETAWNAALGTAPDRALSVLPVRTVTYTALNVGRIFVTGMMVTGSLPVAAGFVGFNLFGDALSYAANDLAWAYYVPVSATPSHP